MTPEQKVADALRVVALCLEELLEEGQRSAQIDACDLIETLVSVADHVDPPLKKQPDPHEQLFVAALALLEAREDGMVTSAEWNALTKATDAVAKK